MTPRVLALLALLEMTNQPAMVIDEPIPLLLKARTTSCLWQGLRTRTLRACLVHLAAWAYGTSPLAQGFSFMTLGRAESTIAEARLLLAIV
jgi:hypothetical protein